jgi:hypothetical protein
LDPFDWLTLIAGASENRQCRNQSRFNVFLHALNASNMQACFYNFPIAFIPSWICSPFQNPVNPHFLSSGRQMKVIPKPEKTLPWWAGRNRFAVRHRLVLACLGLFMKPPPISKSGAFTLIELIVLIVAVIVLVLAVLAMILVPLHPVRNKAVRIGCVNNLKQIGTAYRIWANDNGDRFPALQSTALGGWSDVLTNADQGFLCWTNYAVMANEMGQSTRIVVCPSDERQPAATFSNFANVNLSYFVGVSSDDNQPQSLLGGDRNLGGGTKPARDYGFSPKSGKGNDVAIQTNSKAGPVCWSLKIHSAGTAPGAGNILLGDGSVQQVTSGNFRSNWQPSFGQTTNWPAGHVPSSPSIRVLFP